MSGLGDVRHFSLQTISHLNVISLFVDSTDEVKRLGMGPLLSEISTKMQQKVAKRDDDPLRILVYGIHDTTLAGICASLDVYDQK